MKTVTIGICKEPGTFRAYCAHDGENLAVAKSTSRAEALVQLFDMLATDYTGLFYDGDPGDIFLDYGVYAERHKRCYTDGKRHKPNALMPTGRKGEKMNICTLSGGRASAYCAELAIKKYGKDNVILYFNDTKWEHPDLYRFLEELSKYWGVPITEDSDGRSPEQLFESHHALANNRMPFCSHELKAMRLQKYYKDGDNLIFGIGIEEKHRADRLIAAYQIVAVKTNKWPTIEFPLIENNVSSIDVSEWLKTTGIKEPELYRLGFEHNNCYGGCVRAGKKHWAHLLSVLPEVYKDRERVEESFRERWGKDVHFFKDETLKHYRERIEAKDGSAFLFTEEDSSPIECIGICSLMN